VRVARVAVLGALAAAVAIGSSHAGRSERTHERTAVVAWVTDGDTLRTRDGVRVRLVQIDAPEAGQECYADAATRELARLAPAGARIVLEADPALDAVDRYGRLLRYVVVGGVNANVELVRRGAATPYFFRGERGRYAARLLAAVADARRAKRGMWGACRVSWTPERAVTTRPG
jgi:endonuclease YncB( thermonuclease family)